MIVGPTKALFMDEISTGLDSSTTYQIVKCLRQLCHVMEATIFMSLLQPAPETFELFDDIVLLSEGQVVYHGPREHALEFFEGCGFKCPERKGIADFLQEVGHPAYINLCWTTEFELTHLYNRRFAVTVSTCETGKLGGSEFLWNLRLWHSKLNTLKSRWLQSRIRSSIGMTNDVHTDTCRSSNSQTYSRHFMWVRRCPAS